MLHDISIALATATPEWPGDTPFSCGWTATIAGGSSVNVSRIAASPHVGTHADAPVHVRDGWPAADALPLDVFIGPAIVCGVAPVEPGRPLAVSDLSPLPDGRIERLLVRTGRSIAGGAFPADWPALGTDAIAELLARGLRLLGVDAPSVDVRQSKSLDVHHALFAGGAYNLENLDLRAVPDGRYELLALPVRVEALDAAPVRAVLRAAR